MGDTSPYLKQGSSFKNTQVIRSFESPRVRPSETVAPIRSDVKRDFKAVVMDRGHTYQDSGLKSNLTLIKEIMDLQRQDLMFESLPEEELSALCPTRQELLAFRSYIEYNIFQLATHYNPGDSVEARFHGKWLDAKIMASYDNGQYEVQWAIDKQFSLLTTSKIRQIHSVGSPERQSMRSPSRDTRGQKPHGVPSGRSGCC